MRFLGSIKNRMTHAIMSPRITDIKCIINNTNYKNPNFTRCLDVALEAGTCVSVLLNHSSPTWALH